MRRFFVIAFSIVLLGVAYLAVQHRGQAAFRSNANATADKSKFENPKSETFPAGVQPAVGNPQSEVSHLADDLDSSKTNIRGDLQILSDVLAAYRSNFPHEGNPWGDNEEITAQLTGRNRLKLALVPRNHPAINASGQLCDRWGTPFFFHAESGTKMAIRSAGPDRKMWTADDVVLEP